MPKEIPIENIYFLLCYAWDRLDQAGIVDVGKIESTELVDLFSIVLVKGVEHLARRGLQSGYISSEQELVGIRGRVNILKSARRFLPEHGRSFCMVDEWTPMRS